MIENKILKIEHHLDFLMVSPGAGALFGLTRIGLGLIQIITSVALIIILTIPRLTGKNEKFYNRVWSHLIHGFGNMLAGIFGSIPFIGLGIYLIREIYHKPHSNPEIPSNSTSFIGYKNLLGTKMLNSCLENRGILLTI